MDFAHPECPPTNALTVDANKFPDTSSSLFSQNVPGYVLSQAEKDDKVLKFEYEMHKLEAQILVSRKALTDRVDNASEHKRYIFEASKVYNNHLTEMLRLKSINAKNKKPPILPITFSSKEISELYYVLVQYGSISSVVAQVENTLGENKRRLLGRLRYVPLELRACIEKAVRDIDAALLEWHTKARAAVNHRCLAIQSMIVAEMERTDKDSAVGDKVRRTK